MNTIHSRAASLAAVCCAALATLTVSAGGAATAATGPAAAAPGSGRAPVVTTTDGAVRGAASFAPSCPQAASPFLPPGSMSEPHQDRLRMDRQASAQRQ